MSNIKQQLSFLGAKDLYREYMNTCDKDKMHELLVGTEYIVDKTSKEYAKVLGPNYDLDDIKSFTFEYYFDSIMKGNILKVKSFNQLFGEEYKAYIKKNINPLFSGKNSELKEDIMINDVADSIIDRVDEEANEEMITDIVVRNSNVPIIIEEHPQYKLTKKGYSSVVIMGIITGVVSIAILLLGMYLVR